MSQNVVSIDFLAFFGFILPVFLLISQLFLSVINFFLCSLFCSLYVAVLLNIVVCCSTFMLQCCWILFFVVPFFASSNVLLY